MKTQKIIYTVVCNLWICLVSGQIGIAKSTVNGSSTILDFNDVPGNTKGLILPAVDRTPAGLNSSDNGTFVFDRSDAKIKMFENNAWRSLSDSGRSSSILSNASPETGTKIIVGSPTTNASGIFILESPDKAMILPQIANPHLFVKTPYPGMMCYDTVSKSLALFDGAVWSYWK